MVLEVSKTLICSGSYSQASQSSAIWSGPEQIDCTLEGRKTKGIKLEMEERKAISKKQKVGQNV